MSQSCFSICLCDICIFNLHFKSVNRLMATEAELKQWLSTQPECKLQFILIYLTLKYVYLSNLF